MKKVFDVLKPVLIGAGLYLIIFFIFHPFIVSGPSMEPTFYGGDVVICSPILNMDELAYGDIVIIKMDYKSIIKRIVALPGDSVVITGGTLYVNGNISPYNYGHIDEPGILGDEVTLSDGELIYLGDNRNKSSDSREYGIGHFRDVRFIVKKKIWSN